ncbi:hypothetical protein N0O92_12505 [Alkalihalobacillus sp. MEB130]|uniref:hypothetical protein n=1 Tax=Alkalihalobacillus sp. MEB130 TaxID=2976704 RepID=UPI0028DFF31D|nr:hypothetical protein [Alkalihalobacillus sp. MEB130]MDT8861056.1 hypothetical protein [Alkalihalobacillus sp. MEB130]
MSHEHDCHEFRCPPFVPADAPDDFCIPEECCPKQIPTPKFPSPTSCLPEDVLEDLEERIRAANQLLLNLALSRRDRGAGGADVREEERLRDAFEGLLGQCIRVQVTKENRRRKLFVTGHLCFVGRDFVLLKDEKDKILIPLKNVCSIKHPKKFMEPIHRQELIGIDPCLRRAITLDFGATVARSPELIQLFFGLDLKTFLCFLDSKKRILVKTKNKSIVGSFMDIDDHRLVICKGNKENRIKRDDIGLIRISLGEKRRRVRRRRTR